MREKIQNVMRNIPSMDKMLSMPWIGKYEAEIGRDSVKSVISEVLDDQRKKILKDPDTAFDTEKVAAEAEKRLKDRAHKSLKPLVNATGVVLHTNLGRSLLAEDAVEAVRSVGENYSTLEYSTETGSRGHRNNHVEWLICRLTGAEAAIVVNNNAAAVILCLGAVAKDKEAVISRGELVEIGGSFRIPEIMALSGTKMVDVGTTNMTHLSDYESAISEETAVLLKVHPSNFSIEGYTASVSRDEIAKLAHDNGIIFMEDLGSGMLTDQRIMFKTTDPTVRSCIEAGVDLVTFSGDKLLGGPQIGVIAGSAGLIDKLRKYPLLRALRVDKMTLAAFEATLRLYLKGRMELIPTFRMINRDTEEMKTQARRLRRKLSILLGRTRLKSVFIDVVPVNDTVGGGSFPGAELKGYAVSLKLPELGSAGKLAEKLRLLTVPVITGINEDRILFHVRTLSEKDEKRILDGFKEMFSLESQKA
ncbi:MAG: L-seryl-tRNA(Sec) selenium transferase [Synergistaceae bacterium]|nr:L-seryl-tRNA(Sec) selenium transferase [Synergistaceae bacterium]